MSIGSEADLLQHQQEFQNGSFNNGNLHVKCGGTAGGIDSESETTHKKHIVKSSSTHLLSSASSTAVPLINRSSIKLEIKDESDCGDRNRNNTFLSSDLIDTKNLHEHNNRLTPHLGIIKRRKSDDGNSMCSSMQDSIDIVSENSSLPRKKSTLRTQLAQQIVNSSTKTLKKPMYPVRPSNTTLTSSQCGNMAMDPTCLLAIFKYLPHETLVACTFVCKTWSTIAVDPSLWKKMNCSQYKLSASLLTAIVRRQPENLILDWTNLAKRQLSWLIARIPALKLLSMQGTPIQSVFGLHTCLCPQLHTLDLSFVRSLNDHAIREILSPPKDSRPGTDSKSRLRNLRSLKIAGTDISDVALRYITQGLPYLTHLDLSSCQRVTDSGVAQIGTSPSAIKTLFELDLSSCKLITEVSLDYLSKCESLTRLDLRFVPQVSTQSVIKFAAKSRNDLQVQDIKLVDKRKI